MSKVQALSQTADLMEQGPNDKNVFVTPDFSYLGEWEPKRTDLAGSVRLTRWASRIAKAGFNVFDLAKTLNGKDLVLTLLARLDDDESAEEVEYLLAELFSIILRKPQSWVRENWGTYEALDCLSAWLVLEQLGKVINSGRFLVGAFLPRPAQTQTTNE